MGLSSAACGGFGAIAGIFSLIVAVLGLSLNPRCGKKKEEEEKRKRLSGLYAKSWRDSYQIGANISGFGMTIR